MLVLRSAESTLLAFPASIDLLGVESEVLDLFYSTMVLFLVSLTVVLATTCP